MYTIHYEGGQEIANVEQNGCLFVVRGGSLRREDIAGILRGVEIRGEPLEGEQDLSGRYDLMRCGYFCDKGDTVEFVLEEYPAEELRYEELAGKLEYVAMMAGVEL